MPMFTNKIKAYFGAEEGAYSQVTNREATGDKSVTVDRNEKLVFQRRITLDSFHRAGGALPDGKPVNWKVVVHTPDRKVIVGDIAITYPKKKGNELRLYFKRASGFYPNTGDIWFVFSVPDDQRIHVGHIPFDLWNKITDTEALAPGSAGAMFQAGVNIDDEDEQYQNLMGLEAAKLPVNVETLRYPRDPKLAVKAIENAGYECEVNDDHESFISAATERNYMEAHHILPVSAQAKFENSLDVPANITCLCPLCHRAVHFGELDRRKEIITLLFGARQRMLKDSGIDIKLKDLLALYGIIT